MTVLNAIVEFLLTLAFWVAPILVLAVLPVYLFGTMTRRRQALSRDERISLSILAVLFLWSGMAVIAILLPLDGLHCGARPGVMKVISYGMMGIFCFYPVSLLLAIVKSLRKILLAHAVWMFVLCLLFPIGYLLWASTTPNQVSPCWMQVDRAYREAMAAAQYYEKSSRLPDAPYAYLEGISIDSSGEITATLRKDLRRPIAGETLVIAPNARDDQPGWQCKGGTLPEKYQPAACRGLLPR